MKYSRSKLHSRPQNVRFLAGFSHKLRCHGISVDDCAKTENLYCAYEAVRGAGSSNRFVCTIQGPVSLTIGAQNAIKSCRWSSSFYAPAVIRGTASRLQNVLWDGFLTPEGSDRVPNYLRILHDMIALLQENKIRKREVSISTYTSRYAQPQTSFSDNLTSGNVYRIMGYVPICKILLTRASPNLMATFCKGVLDED